MYVHTIHYCINLVMSCKSLTLPNELRYHRSSCSFIEKTSVKQDPKSQVCSNFQMSLLHLSQMDPPVDASQVSLTFGQADL